MKQSPKPSVKGNKGMEMPILNGISGLADDYDAFIFDIWGVLHNGVRAYPGVKTCLENLRGHGKAICLLSNSPNRATYIPDQLEQFGIPRSAYDHVITSGESVWREIKNYEGQTIYCFDEVNPTCLENIHIHQTENPDMADIALIIHVPRMAETTDYNECLKILLKRNIPLICANPDKVVDIGGTLYPCAGAIADVYEAMGGQVHWHGKPYAPVYEWAMSLMDNPSKDRTLAIGDSIRTDVTGASDFGIDVLWNAVGIHWQDISKDGIIDQDQLYNSMRHLNRKPRAVLNGLAW